MSGIKAKIFACVGSAGGGLRLVCSHMVKPMMIGNKPIIRKLGGSHGMSPKRLKTVVGSGADKSLIQPKNGACRISMVTNSTLYSEKNTGICKATGRQPAIGLIFSFL